MWTIRQCVGVPSRVPLPETPMRREYVHRVAGGVRPMRMRYHHALRGLPGTDQRQEMASRSSHLQHMGGTRRPALHGVHLEPVRDCSGPLYGYHQPRLVREQTDTRNGGCSHILSLGSLASTECHGPLADG